MTYCGSDCCKECSRLPECGGCEKTGGHPFGGSCIAERNRDFPGLKKRLIDELNSLGIEGLAVDTLYLLNGAFVNLEYPLSNGTAVRFLNDNDVYLGCQIERTGSERCFGVVANEAFILVQYGIAPLSVQVAPTLPHHLGTRIFRKWNASLIS